MRGGVRGGQKRKLVERQRPPGAVRHREDHRLGRIPFDRGDAVPELVDLLEPAEADRPGHRHRRTGADCDEQGVVGHLGVRVGDDHAPLVVHRGERRAAVEGVAVPGDLVEREPRRIREAEGHRDRELAVAKVVLGGHEGRLDAIARDVAERKEPLEPGDPAAGDHHSEPVVSASTHARNLSARRTVAIGDDCRSTCGKPAGSRALFADATPAFGS